MRSSWRQIVIDMLWETPAWAFLFIGVLLLGATLLIGPYLENRKLAWQRDYIQAQADRLAQQEQSYRQLLAALKANDPVLVQRMAFHYLHLKPEGTQVFMQASNSRADGSRTIRLVSEPINTADGWAHRPMPTIGQDFPAYSTLDTLLVRMTTGPLRLVVIILAGACLLLAMIPMSHLARKPAYVRNLSSRPTPNPAGQTIPTLPARPTVAPTPTTSVASAPVETGATIRPTPTPIATPTAAALTIAPSISATTFAPPEVSPEAFPETLPALEATPPSTPAPSPASESDAPAAAPVAATPAPGLLF